MVQTSFIGDDVVAERDMETGEQMAFLNPDDYKSQKTLDGQMSLDLSGKTETSSRSKAKETASKMLDVLKAYVKRVIGEMPDMSAADVKRLVDETVISETEQQGNVSGETFDQAAMKLSEAESFEEFVDKAMSKTDNKTNDEYFRYVLPSDVTVDVMQQSVTKNPAHGHPLTTEQIKDLLNSADDIDKTESVTIENEANTIRGIKVVIKTNTAHGKENVVFSVLPGMRIFLISTYIGEDDTLDSSTKRLTKKGSYVLQRPDVVASRESGLKVGNPSSVLSIVQSIIGEVNAESYEQSAYHGLPYKFLKFALAVQSRHIPDFICSPIYIQTLNMSQAIY